MMNFRKICKTLGKTEELPMFPIEAKCLETIKVTTSVMKVAILINVRIVCN